jgi:hypothetical protein
MLCCLNREVDLLPITDLPCFLQRLLDGRDTRSADFLRSIQRYNSALILTSCNFT